jgi:hypothetical protein
MKEIAKKKACKVIQFAIILHLLQQGCSMLKYEFSKSLFEFLVIPRNSKKH